ncbi:MAG TPA: hypothetical protein DCS97_16370 [Planctomycetes bacterium]|nr:hypothetical protein [Planctomycetota bacterium]
MMPAIPGFPDTLPAGFDHQLDSVTHLSYQAWKWATKAEWDRAAGEMGMLLSDGSTYLLGESDPANARLIEWVAFETQRDGRPIITAAAEDLGRGLSAGDLDILAALQRSSWSLMRIEEHRRGIGARMCDLWTDEQRIVLSRRLEQQVPVGAHLLVRTVTVGDCTTMTALIARITQEVLDRLTGSILESGRSAFEVIADDPELRRKFVRKTFALPTVPRPAIPLTGGNRQRNMPCPCGSGRKFKVCCGRGR